MELSMVMVRMPPRLGNCAVSAVATPSSKSDTSPSTCSCRNMMSAITPMAKKPGISRTVCSQPISEPSKSATSMTKLFRSADQVAKDTGIAIAMRNSSITGRRQYGSDWASDRETNRMGQAITPNSRRCLVLARWRACSLPSRREERAMSDKIEVENVNQPGHVGRVDAAKYHAMKAAMLNVMTHDAPGQTAAEIKEAAKAHLPG